MNKTTIIFSFVMLFMLCVSANAQEESADAYMVVNNHDGSKDIFNTTNVDSVTFVNKSKASSLTTKKKIVIGWGDSLTAGAGGNGVSYPSVLQSLLGDEYQVINAGVGGEKTYTITARQGSNPMTISEDVTVLNNGEYTDIVLVDYYGNELKPLLQGGDKTINPCLINGHECNIRWTGDRLGNDGVYQITTTDTTSFIMKKNTPILTNYMRTYSNPYAIIIWIGQNGGFSDGDDLCDQIQRMIDYAGTDKYIVINFHTNYYNSFNNNLLHRFGNHVIDWNTYTITKALDDDCIEKTEQDAIDIENGICPSSLRVDKVHLNAGAYSLLAKLRRNGYSLWSISKGTTPKTVDKRYMNRIKAVSLQHGTDKQYKHV